MNGTLILLMSPRLFVTDRRDDEEGVTYRIGLSATKPRNVENGGVMGSNLASRCRLSRSAVTKSTRFHFKKLLSNSLSAIFFRVSGLKLDTRCLGNRQVDEASTRLTSVLVGNLENTIRLFRYPSIHSSKPAEPDTNSSL